MSVTESSTVSSSETSVAENLMLKHSLMETTGLIMSQTIPTLYIHSIGSRSNNKLIIIKNTAEDESEAFNHVQNSGIRHRELSSLCN
jgi:isoprenylcysteine carboxyl methyltransferase (ICMT) family protein YpbQ